MCYNRFSLKRAPNKFLPLSYFLLLSRLTSGTPPFTCTPLLPFNGHPTSLHSILLKQNPPSLVSFLAATTRVVQLLFVNVAAVVVVVAVAVRGGGVRAPPVLRSRFWVVSVFSWRLKATRAPAISPRSRPQSPRVLRDDCGCICLAGMVDGVGGLFVFRCRDFPVKGFYWRVVGTFCRNRLVFFLILLLSCDFI